MLRRTPRHRRPSRPRPAVDRDASGFGVWCGTTGEQVYRQAARARGGVHLLAFSPDRRLLATADADGRVALLSTRDWQSVGAVTAGTCRASAIAFPDPDHLVTAHVDGRIRTWETASGACVAERVACDRYSGSVWMSADASVYVVSRWSSGRSTVHDLAGGRELAAIKGRVLMLSPNGRFALCGGVTDVSRHTRRTGHIVSNTVDLVQVSNGSVIGQLRGPVVWGAAVSADGRIIVTCGRGDFARVWSRR